MPYTSYAGDPYWTVAKFASVCKTCQGKIKRGEKIFYYPKGKHVFCANCGKLEYAKFREAAEAEYALGGGSSSEY